MALFYPGLVSVSFRPLSPTEVIAAAKGAGLSEIEWGGDVHVPSEDPAMAETVSKLQKAAATTCCSYGTYFRLGIDPLDRLGVCFAIAKKLGTDTVRIWAGKKGWREFSPEERSHLEKQAASAAEYAEKEKIVLCTECHPNTATDCPEGTLALIGAASSPNFRTYWQPNRTLSEEENIAFASAVSRYVRQIHVFNWSRTERFPLDEGTEQWKKYLSALGECDPDASRHGLLLEFMPDDLLETLPREAEGLRKILKEI